MDHKSFRSVLILVLICFLASCKVPSEDIGYEVVSDTIYITRLVDRCNYQYLSTDPKKAEKQIKENIKRLDLLIIQYDQELSTKRKKASQKFKELKYE